MMRTLALLTGCALLLGAATADRAAADGVLFNYQLIPGPSGYRGPAPRGPAPGTARPTTVQRPAPVTTDNRFADRAWMEVAPGEPDETGRIGPTLQVDRDPDGKRLPSYHPR